MKINNKKFNSNEFQYSLYIIYRENFFPFRPILLFYAKSDWAYRKTYVNMYCMCLHVCYNRKIKKKFKKSHVTGGAKNRFFFRNAIT